MIFISEKQKKINDMYSRLQNLKECKKIIERAMHNNYYNRPVYDRLFIKLKKVIAQINELKQEIIKEKEDEESGKNV